MPHNPPEARTESDAVAQPERDALHEEEQTTEETSTEEPKKTKKSGKKKKSKKPKKKLSEKQKTVRAARRLITKVVVVAVIAVVLLTVVGNVTICHDNNMFPAVCDGDLVIAYRLGGYYNGDVVIYQAGDTQRIGRVVGIPGDVIDINDEEGCYTINGTMPYETIYFATRKAAVSNISYPYTVQEGEVFILNDMRDDTYDSRVLGGITDLKGKAVLIVRRRGF